METQYSNWTRWGVATLPFIAILDLVGMFLRGPVIDVTVNAQGFAQSAASPNYGTAWVIILISQVFTLLSFLVLYSLLKKTHTKQLSLIAMVLSIIGVALFSSLIGFMAFAAPVAAKLYLQGDAKMLDVMAAGFFAGPVTGVLYSSGSFGALGSILFGIAIWRSGTLPKWAAIPYALSTILLAFAPAFSLAAEALGAVLLLISGAWIVASVWHSASTQARASSPARA